MICQAFSCARPLPEHMDKMHEPASAAELDALIEEGSYTQDLGRSIYLVARRDAELVRHGIVCCGDVDELAEMAQAADPTSRQQDEDTASPDMPSGPASAKFDGDATGSQRTDDGAAKAPDGAIGTAGLGVHAGEYDAALAHLSELGAHAEPVVVEYEPNYALDVIVSAAQSATPLYNLSNGSDLQVVVWRVSRTDAVEAICAMLGSMEGRLAGGHTALAAATTLANEAREKRPNLDARSVVLHPLCLLVPTGQDMSKPLLPSNGLLMHRFA